jgi:hypothetical protein
MTTYQAGCYLSSATKQSVTKLLPCVILCCIINILVKSGERREKGGEIMFAKQNGDGYRLALAGIEQKT